MRLDKTVSAALGLTRREGRALIAAGRVTVDGAVCKKADRQLTGTEKLLADGKPAVYVEYVYLMLNKPAGILSATEDGRGRTAVDLVRGDFPRRALFPAGRLDKDSTGFILLTDDGPFAHSLLSPRRHVPKTYAVTLDAPVSGEMIEGFAAGLTLADGTALLPARLQPDKTDPCRCTVVLTQGVYHQIKRMFGVYGAGVNKLHRTAIGALQLDETLRPGEYRPITAGEKALLENISSGKTGKFAAF